MINVGINQASAVLRAPYGVFQASADARALMRSLMQEVVVLAEKAGIGLTAKDLDEWGRILTSPLPRQAKPPCSRMWKPTGKTEVEIFAGKVVALGKDYHVPTPVNETILRIINVIESLGGA